MKAKKCLEWPTHHRLCHCYVIYVCCFAVCMLSPRATGRAMQYDVDVTLCYDAVTLLRSHSSCHVKLAVV